MVWLPYVRIIKTIDLAMTLVCMCTAMKRTVLVFLMHFIVIVLIAAGWVTFGTDDRLIDWLS